MGRLQFVNGTNNLMVRLETPRTRGILDVTKPPMVKTAGLAMNRVLILLASVQAGWAVPCMAQGRYFGEAKYTIEWNDNGNKNGVVEPGEKAIGQIHVSFSPGSGAWITLPSGVDAQIRALHKVVLGVTPMSASGGMLVPKDVAPFTPTGAPDEFWGNTITEVIRLQLAKPIYPQMTFDNPAHVLDVIWDPEGDYTPRDVLYQVDGKGTLVFYELPPFPGIWGGVPFISIDSEITRFQVVPAPAAGAVLGASAIMRAATRRRRS